MVATDEKLMLSLETDCRHTQPLMNHLYRGMTLDAVTGLYNERAGDYSPGLGGWMEQDPAQCINGSNAYQFVVRRPMAKADPKWRFWGWTSNVGSTPAGAAGYVAFGIGAVAEHASPHHGGFVLGPQLGRDHRFSVELPRATRGPVKESGGE